MNFFFSGNFCQRIIDALTMIVEQERITFKVYKINHSYVIFMNKKIEGFKLVNTKLNF